jgi:hypothetical protein
MIYVVKKTPLIEYLSASIDCKLDLGVFLKHRFERILYNEALMGPILFCA